ncbi:hypothetical protein [Hyphomonas sp.]|jgi:hypothetical protein|uniref:hypothetical protein n=1 Tax=Hyphomonas sp. TaxID=87 RepID=UPI0039E221B0
MNRFLSAIAAICLVSMPALAEDVSTDDVYACVGISTDAERLACYDAAVGRLKAAEDAGEVTTITRSEVEKVNRDSFGFSIRSLPSLPSLALKKNGGSDKELDEITTGVTSVRMDSAGRLRVTLDNGQVWVQIDDKSTRASNQTEARIYSAALGSYKMKLDGGLAFRVRREQ